MVVCVCVITGTRLSLLLSGATVHMQGKISIVEERMKFDLMYSYPEQLLVLLLQLGLHLSETLLHVPMTLLGLQETHA